MDRTVDDPLLQQAVLDLFRANEAFRSAYVDYQRTGDRETVIEAEARIDVAREFVVHAQTRLPREP